MKTNYLGHDRVYRHKRSVGETGWDAPEQRERYLATVETLLSGVGVSERPSPSLLEFGCGAGDATLHFARKGWKAFGIDISPFAIDWAREKAAAEQADATFFVGDLSQRLSLPCEPVDLVLDGHCLHCIIGEERRMFLQNAMTYLRSDGLLCIDTMCGDPIDPAVRRDFDPESRCLVRNGIAGRYFGLPETILQEISLAGLEIVRHDLVSATDDSDQDSLVVLARPLEESSE